MKIFLGHRLERRDAVHAGLVDEDAWPAQLLPGFGKETPDIAALGDVRLERDGPAAGLDDLAHDPIGVCFVRGVLHRHCRLAFNYENVFGGFLDTWAGR